jgi:hypothetical protein
MEVGVTENDGVPVVLVHKCRGKRVESLQLETRRQADGSGGTVLWHVERDPGPMDEDAAGPDEAPVVEVALGQTPEGFRETVPMHSSLPDGDLTAEFRLSTGLSGYKVFEISQLKPDVVQVPGNEVSEQEFAERRLLC